MNNEGKFLDEKTTAKDEKRAFVSLNALNTLWFNTGTQCNLECSNCYIESSPKNDRLIYLTPDQLTPYLDEAKVDHDVELIAFTGGEPFLNPNIIQLIEEVLKRGFSLLILTNAYRVLKKHKDSLLRFNQCYPDLLKIRVSLDHYTEQGHEQERGEKTFLRTLEEVRWLYENGFDLSLAGRSLKEDTYEQAHAGYLKLLKDHSISWGIESQKLAVFPEMDLNREVPEITTECWGILNKSPDDQMCASERMIVHKKGRPKAEVMPCTLLAYDDKFSLGTSLKEAKKDVYLNHPFCAQFCVLGGASCSAQK